MTVMVPMTRMTQTTPALPAAGTIRMIPMTQMSLARGFYAYFVRRWDDFCVPSQSWDDSPTSFFARGFLCFPFFFNQQASNMSDTIMIARPCVKAIWQPLENTSFRDENPRPGSLRLPAFSFQPGSGSHQFRAVATFQVGNWALHGIIG